tara:strand:- start:81 stop:317 length:237 start_codon:yes stop_codon:yes gene_type:complete
MAMTLYDKLKPHIKDKLDAQADKYISIGLIYDKLKNKNQYNELTIDDIRTIHTFTDIWYKDVDTLDLIYGDHLFNEKI